jgi:hypothetical protein
MLIVYNQSVCLDVEPPGTCDLILLPFGMLLEDQVPVFMSPRKRVAQLNSRALGSLYVASNDSQGYGGCILTLP